MPPHLSAYCMRSPRLVARCWSAEDAGAFRALLDRNDRHLRPFIPWMRDEPQPLASTRARLQRYRERFLAGEDFRYALLHDSGALLGELIVSTRTGAGSREVGYLIDHAATGRGYATEAAAMATRMAFEFALVERVELHCSPENTGSVRVAEKLGFALLHTRQRHYEDSEGTLRDLMMWQLDRAGYLRSPAAALPLTASDGSGAALVLQSVAATA